MNQSKSKLLQTSASHTYTIWKDPPDSREFTKSYLENDPVLYISYRHLTSPYRERLLDFLWGAKTLPLTYDPFFKIVFDPVLHPERLSGAKIFPIGICGRSIRLSFSRTAPISSTRIRTNIFTTEKPLSTPVFR